MKIIEAIGEVLKLSIENAEQWMKDGVCLIDNNSIAHGSVLLDFAGEEIAKAYVCWQVLIGAYPPDHPIVRANKKISFESLKKEIENETKKIKERVEDGKSPGKNISVFSSHEIKDSVLIDLGQLINNIGRSILGLESPSEISEEAHRAIESIMLYMGKIGTWKRMKWMYVNLESTGKGFEVTSPLKEEFRNLSGKIKLHQYEIDFLKAISQRPLEEFSELAEELKSIREKTDLFWPRKRK